MSSITYAIMACYPDKGMKSQGSKGLLSFDEKKLFEHQLEWIKKNNKNNYEIILVCDFDIYKIKKTLTHKISIYEIEDHNPIFTACNYAKYEKIIFIDYGCVFKPKILSDIKQNNQSSILCLEKNTNDNVDTGCIIVQNRVEHLYLDLESNYFTNIFSLCSEDKQKILGDSKYKNFNLLYFEILNMLISSGSTINSSFIDHKDFIYFTQMRQKNAINKFIKNISN